MDMLFGWSALRQNCYVLKCSINLKWKQIPISLNSWSPHIVVLQWDILRRDYVPITIHILPRLQKEQNRQVKQVCLAQDAPTEASLSCGFATLLHPSAPEPGLDLRQRWCTNKACKLPSYRATASLQCSTTCGTRTDKWRGLAGEEQAFPLQEFELQFYTVFRVRTKLRALRGNYHGLLFCFLLSIYQIGRDTQI